MPDSCIEVIRRCAVSNCSRVLAAAVVGALVSVAAGSPANVVGRAEGLNAAQSKAAAPNDNKVLATTAVLLTEAKSLRISAPNQAIGAEVSSKLTAWGRLRLVSDSSPSDLQLEITRRGPRLETESEHRTSETSGAEFGARLTDARTGAELWRTDKGATWQLSDARGEWAGRQIADAFVKYFDSVVSGQRSAKAKR
jgi:hypothetical protein